MRTSPSKPPKCPNSKSCNKQVPRFWDRPMGWVRAHCDSSNLKHHLQDSPSVRPVGFFMPVRPAPHQKYPRAVFGKKEHVWKYFALGNTFPKSGPTIERRKSQYCSELLTFLLTFFSNDLGPDPISRCWSDFPSPFLARVLQQVR